MGRSPRVLRLVVLAAAALFAVTLAGPGAPAVHAVFEDRDRDGAIDIAEETAGSDPDNPSSTPETTGTEIVAGYNACSDGIDNDRDGLIDADNNPWTGYQSSVDYSCWPLTAALGVDTQLYMEPGGGILVPVYQNLSPPLPGAQPLPIAGVPEQPYALALSGERSITLVVPLREMGRDDIFDFAVLVRGGQYQTTDCAPNGGHIRSPNPARPGDVNCDGRTNSLDAMLIMQSFARLPVTLPCAYAGDVNGNGGLGPLDAILILQYDAGLIDELPPVPHSALEAAIRETGRLLNVLRGLLTVVGKEAEQWPDSCLGLPEDGEACLQVVTPGYRITVATAPGSGLPRNQLIWRTNADGREVRLESWAVE